MQIHTNPPLRSHRGGVLLLVEADGPGWAAGKRGSSFQIAENLEVALAGNVDSSCGWISTPKLGDALGGTPETSVNYVSAKVNTTQVVSCRGM